MLTSPSDARPAPADSRPLRDAANRTRAREHPTRYERQPSGAILFDIDGTLITSGGAGAEAWRLAFLDLYGIPVDIGHFSDAGMTDPEVGRRTFAALLERDPGDGGAAERGRA